jgi:hypothetical protein
MANWFTIHGPKPYDLDLAYDVYLQDKYESIADEIMIGDKVFFYELKGSGRLKINQQIYKTPVGKMGLVHVGQVTGKPYKRSLYEGQSETYGTGKAYWSIGIPTDAEASVGFVPREVVVSVLGYQPNYFFKGFGGGKGIKLIDDSQAHELLAQFNK